jgi:hypothetical protein
MRNAQTLLLVLVVFFNGSVACADSFVGGMWLTQAEWQRFQESMAQLHADPSRRTGDLSCDRIIGRYLACFEGQNMQNCVAHGGSSFCQSERAGAINDVALQFSMALALYGKPSLMCSAQFVKRTGMNPRKVFETNMNKYRAWFGCKT